MKKLGLIGGVGPESTIAYYRLLINQFQEKLGTKDYPELLINSVNMTKMLGYVFSKQTDKLVDFIFPKIEELEKAGADFAAIASNTPHVVFDKLAQKASIPIISIVEETCKKISELKLQHVGLFGTKATMTNGIYNQTAEKYNIEVIVPDAASQDYIHEKYMNELVHNKILPDTKARLIQIASELIEKESIQGLILGGTELPLILSQSDFDGMTVLDTTEIHVDSLVSLMIEDGK